MRRENKIKSCLGGEWECAKKAKEQRFKGRKASLLRNNFEGVTKFDIVGPMVTSKDIFGSFCMFGRDCWRVNSVHVKEAWKTACGVNSLEKFGSRKETGLLLETIACKIILLRTGFLLCQTTERKFIYDRGTLLSRKPWYLRCISPQLHRVI